MKYNLFEKLLIKNNFNIKLKVKNIKNQQDLELLKNNEISFLYDDNKSENDILSIWTDEENFNKIKTLLNY